MPFKHLTKHFATYEPENQIIADSKLHKNRNFVALKMKHVPSGDAKHAKHVINY